MRRSRAHIAAVTSSAVPGRGRLSRAWAAPIAGAGCSRPSRARAAPLQARFTAVPSSAEPGHAATRACCSNASTGRAGGRTRHGLIPPLEAPWCMICMGGTARPAFLRMMIVRAAIAVCACCTRAEASGHYGVLCSEQCCARACNHACVPAVICSTCALGGSLNPQDSTFGVPCQAWNQHVPPVSVNLLQLPSFGSEFYLACFLSLSLSLLTPPCFLFAPHLPKPTLSLLNSLILSSCLSLFLPLFVLLGHHSVSFALSFSCSLAPSFSLPSPSKPLARPGHTIVFARRTTKGQPCD